MSKKSYYEKLKDPRWQRKRLEILKRDNFQCQSCHTDKVTLHIHHIQYLPVKNPWDYPDNYLATLCKDCHSEEEVYSTALKDRIVELFNLGIDNSDTSILLSTLVFIRKNKIIEWAKFESLLIDMATLKTDSEKSDDSFNFDEFDRIFNE